MLSQCCVRAATINGVTALPVSVEVVLGNGLPGFTIVGMTDAAIQEARERIRAALKASGFTMPREKIVVNLAPGSIKKRGSGFDLPIAIAILVASKQIDRRFARNVLYAGELSLDGRIRPVPGLLAYAKAAQDQGLNLVCADSNELGIGDALLHTDIVRCLNDFRTGEHYPHEESFDKPTIKQLDFADIAGHDRAKRALQIAATGNHGVLLIGPPGSGKTMLASRMPSILPPLSAREMLECATIYSIAGEPTDQLLDGVRPFRKPHHSASLAGLVGGGTPVRPGEISLAHNGVLFLDELPEFKPSVLQGLRQPMEAGMITAVRAEGSVELPAKFSLIAAANPCPCGHFGDKEHSCTCTPQAVRNYRNRIGGPVFDRIDMRVDVCRLPSENVFDSGNGVSSEALYSGVMAGREYKSWRVSKGEGCANSVRAFIDSCQLTDEAIEFFEAFATRKNLSGRGIIRVLSIARTIADIEQRDRVGVDELFEASSFRIEDVI